MPAEHDLGYQVIFLQFKAAQLAVDLEWLETLERLWPSPCPPQDSVIAPNDTPPSTAEDTLNSLTRQLTCIVSLEQLCREWKNEVLDIWHTHDHNLDQASTVNSLHDAIHANITKRLFREARLIYILGALVAAWRDHVHCASPLSGSDLRILRECRAIIEQDSFDAALEAPKIEFAGTADSSTSPDRRETNRSPDFATGMELVPPTVLQTRRELIQNEWNKAAGQAGAAGIEFVNDVDDEEVPPGIGVLFPCPAISGSPDLVLCSDAVAITQWVAKTQADVHAKPHSNVAPPFLKSAQGLFTFNTESEIIECNNCCECLPECPNRVAQFPRQIPVQVFKTGKRGWGARVAVNLTKGQVVGLYTGRREEANKLSGSRASYCFDLDVNEDPDEEPPEHVYSVDAYACGNWTRFLKYDHYLGQFSV
ncbi:hypothetical protein B0H11DRAFT_2221342 [Mycena galericulata]|nr:hypothetical protein B0H11DRAFT_2221342 [Mycena galericulata]